ncbi:hypothetical protein OHQ88_33655 (plasmid) [Micromonospora zamorensis]|uniref:hypothetical protein n=1 Tax=Micromonospora zamorensis TaxID=709883 RepID=UPI002E1DF325
MTAEARTSVALTAWTELNDRQQGTLRAIYNIDQQIEEIRRRDAALGKWDGTPAVVWRRIDFTHEPSDRRLVGLTDLQIQLELYGWDNQGNGSTMAALASRGLITRNTRGTALGVMHTVALTRSGRATARAGISWATGPRPRVGLSQRAWEVLALLWTADLRGQPLTWTYSATIEHVLIDKHVPPLAEPCADGYRITDRGRDFYRNQHAAHTAAYPIVTAPHPDGVDAEPWPARADELLDQHRTLYRALVKAWSAAHDMHLAAEAEAGAEPPTPAAGLPTAVTEQATAVHQLWQETAGQRAKLANEHLADVRERAERAARAYAAAALGVFHAAITQADPLADLHPPDHADVWDEPPLSLRGEAGIHAIDAAVKKLHATAVGAPLKRRGPAPKRRRTALTRRPERPPQPGAELAALADYLRDHTHGGALLRRLHH